jgi:lysophospholipase L1-like esterase
MADRLVERFDLEAPSDIWKGTVPYITSTALRTSGDFSTCAKWGARTDDLLADNSQILDCFPEDERHKKTLVVMTIGGNDVASFTKSGVHAPYEDTQVKVAEYVQLLDEAVAWFYEPGRFPNGVKVVFANMFEFTDASGDVNSCPAAGAAGFDETWDHPEWLEEFVIWANEEYMRIAVEHGADMIFLLEKFCGHGFKHDDPTSRCYRGPDAERWFDLTCIHPNPTGHEQIADMFMAVIDG